MSEIRDLLDADTRAKLAQVTVKQQDSEPAFIIRKASTDPNPPRTLRSEDALDIDPDSEAMIEAACVDCRTSLLIEPKLPEGADPEALRFPICAPCGKIRARFAAINEQRNVEVIQRRHRIAQRQPRTTDGIDHPVTVTEAPEAKTKENDMYDLKDLSDVELGAAVRADLLARAAEALPAKRDKAKAKQRKADKQAKDNVKQRQSERKDMVLAEFAVGKSLIVPALDLTGVEDLNEEATTTLRSPYNKARFRLAGERPLWAPKDEDEDGYTPTTYQTLIDEHGRLMALAAEKAQPKAKKAKAKPQILALLDDDVEASVTKKVKALAKLADITKDEARAIVLAGMSL